MSDQKTALVWFRQDLRLHDNPALYHAVTNGYKVIPVYVHDQENAGEWATGEAAAWWIFKSLHSLNQDLKNKITFRAGKADEVIPSLIKETGAQAVFWNRCYEPWQIARDKAIKETLQNDGIEVQSFNGSLLWEPWEILKDDGTPYKVFTPYYRKGCLGRGKEPSNPVSVPKSIHFADFKNTGRLEDLKLLPEIKWYTKLDPHWDVSEQGALDRLNHFLENGLKGYKEKRNIPSLDHVSKMSPYLKHGNISIRTIWHKARAAGIAQHAENDMDHFCSELGWREFSYALLYHFPELPRKPLQPKFENFPWATDDGTLLKWQQGLTGIPLVDAGMRELWETGWMHNRVRMVVASLLVKNMLLHWHHGEDWFWDCLVDADLANNSASWQWVAGCGADAAPYFRIFNPLTQGEKFDPDLSYIKKWVPEYGTPHYPDPIVDVKASRQKALEAYGEIK